MAPPPELIYRLSLSHTPFPYGKGIRERVTEHSPLRCQRQSLKQSKIYPGSRVSSPLATVLLG